MTINVPLLRKTLEWAYGEHLKAERGEVSEWSQGDWMAPTRDVQPWNLDREDVDAAVQEGTACGTACCIAGKVAYDEGWRPVAFQGGTITGRDGRVDSAFEVGARLLGLNDGQAKDLFNGCNTIGELYWIAGGITDGEIEPPPGLGPVR